MKSQAHLLVMYPAPKDPAAFDRAWQFVRGKIYRNKSDASGGFRPIRDSLNKFC